jgi:F-type H+-transporting ATPase subunit alpha
LERGLRLTELLKQPQYQPVSLENQVIAIFALTNGYGDSVPVDKIQQYEADILQYIQSNHPGIGQAIASQKVISDETETALKAALAAYNQSAGYEVPA